MGVQVSSGHVILDYLNSRSNGAGAGARLTCETPTLNVYFRNGYDGVNSMNFIASSSGVCAAGQWVHVVATYSVSSKETYPNHRGTAIKTLYWNYDGSNGNVVSLGTDPYNLHLGLPIPQAGGPRALRGRVWRVSLGN